jgi:methionine synthase II (cobalamin-independent)
MKVITVRKDPEKGESKMQATEKDIIEMLINENIELKMELAIKDRARREAINEIMTDMLTGTDEKLKNWMRSKNNAI